MKILAFTDVHGHLEYMRMLRKKAEKADIIICAGDFTTFESQITKVMQAMDRLGKKIFLIHGNHEDETLVAKMCSRLEHIECIHKKGKAYTHLGKEYLIIGYGGGGFSLVDKGFERFTKKFVGRKNIILVTHAPPYGTKLDMLWEHRGNKSITAFIKKAKPLLAINGHFHENFYKRDKIGRTLVINPGPEGRIVEV